MNSNNNIRLAINELGGDGWTGGITYRNNLIKSILAFYPEVKIFLLTSDGKHDSIDERVERISLIKPKGIFEKAINKIWKRAFKIDLFLKKSIDPYQINLVFPSTYFVGKGKGIVFWFPDFQFLHLPHMYQKSQLKSMQEKLLNYFERVPLIILSSKDAQKDFEKFAPQFLGKTRVMNFVAHVPSEMLVGKPKEILSIYNLPEEFVYLPNQFWKHKNHQIVFKALSILKKKGIIVDIVCTGNLNDGRNPQYLGGLMKEAAELGISKQITLLGLLPHEHVYALIRQSKFVINPSLFEGWSTSVEETKSVGKRMIVSDLGVHREQNPPNSLYFDPLNEIDLANKIEEMWHLTNPGPDLEMEKEAKSNLGERMENFAKTFLNIGKESIELTK